MMNDDDVLAFLRSLWNDGRRAHSLNSGRRLLAEAAQAGLVEANEPGELVAHMTKLHDTGLISWTPSRSDRYQEDLRHATEFHLTRRGQQRLAAIRSNDSARVGDVSVGKPA